MKWFLILCGVLVASPAPAACGILARHRQRAAIRAVTPWAAVQTYHAARVTTYAVLLPPPVVTTTTTTTRTTRSSATQLGPVVVPVAPPVIVVPK